MAILHTTLFASCFLLVSFVKSLWFTSNTVCFRFYANNNIFNIFRCVRNDSCNRVLISRGNYCADLSVMVLYGVN